MRVRCTKLEYGELTPSQQGRVPTSSLDGWVTIDALYDVFGIAEWGTQLTYLVRSDSTKPIWAPAGLFEVIDNLLPSHWAFTLRDGIATSGDERSDKFVFLAGYGELVNDPAHNNELIERDSKALQIFARHYLSTIDERNPQGE